MDGRATLMHTFFNAALDAITNGSSTAPVFARIGIKNIGQLLAAEPNLRTSPASSLFETAIAQLQEQLFAANPDDPNAGIMWPDASKGKKYLRAIVSEAQSLEATMQSEIQQWMRDSLAEKRVGQQAPANGSKELVHASESKANKASLEVEGAKIYNDATKIFKEIPTLAADRVKYTLCAEMRAAWVEGCPYAHPLTDYHLELKCLGSKGTTYSAFGQEWTTKEAAEKSVEIKDLQTLRRQMQRRKYTRIVAGAFDVAECMRKRGEPMPEPPQIIPSSTVKYITKEAGASEYKVHTIVAFASPEGQELEIKAMDEFMARNPHVSPDAIVRTLDAKIQQELANLIMQGWTADAAVYQICKKSPELYNATQCETSSSGSSGAGTSTSSTASATASKRKTSERTDAEQNEVLNKRLAQQEAQIKNLKEGRKGPGGNRSQPNNRNGGGGYGNNNNNGGGYNGGGGGYWHNAYGPPPPQYGAPPQAQYGGQQQGAQQGGGPVLPQVKCPPNVCKNFNFKAAGCVDPNCRFKATGHVCAVCGQAHSARGNH
jgi:hypothetical protein